MFERIEINGIEVLAVNGRNGRCTRGEIRCEFFDNRCGSAMECLTMSGNVIFIIEDKLPEYLTQCLRE